jgi:chemotaxis protein CheX
VPDPINYQELARQYGLEPVPQSVLHLTEIVSRLDADLEDVAHLISKDASLTQRLLRAANPTAKSEADYDVQTVDEALMRNGLGCALLLAMGTPLAHALVKTFVTMLSLKLESIDRSAALPLEGKHILGTIGFAGRATGLVYLRLNLASANEIAARLLGLDLQQIAEPAVVNDTVGELLNIITGNFKSNLCDAGLDCRLQTPRVTQTEEFSSPNMPGGSLERMTFRAGKILLFVDVWVNPWSNE